MTPTLVLPSKEDVFVAGAVEAIGGPPGRHARIGAHRFWTPVRVLVALTLLTCVLGWLQKAPCRDGRSWQHEFQYTRACYTDVVALYSAERLSEGKRPYFDHPVEYPVVTGFVMQLSANLADAFTPEVVEGDNAAYRTAINRAKHFYDVTWALLTLCAVVGVVTTARLAGHRPWDAALFALAPGLLLHGTTNWDLLAVALSGLGLVAWARRRPVLAGLLLGVGAATKLYPILFLVPLLLLCLRAGKVRAWLAAAVAAVVAAVGLTLPVYLTAPSFAEIKGTQTRVLDSPLDRFGDDGLAALAPHEDVPSPEGQGTVRATNAVWRFFDLNRTRPADWDSIYLQVQHLRTDDGFLKGLRNGLADLVSDPGGTPKKLNAVVAALEVLLVVLLAVLVLRAPRRPRVPQVLFLFLAGFLLVNKVNSPQYVIWLLPLAVLARPRWRPFLAWQAAEALVLLSRFYFFVGNDKPGQGIDIGLFFSAVLLRNALLVWVMVSVALDILRPERDVVRRDGADDPAGGVLDGAPDRQVARSTT